VGIDSVADVKLEPARGQRADTESPVTERHAFTGPTGRCEPGRCGAGCRRAVECDDRDLDYFSNAAGGRDLVIVATEANNVYALDAASGSPVWIRNLGVSASASIT